MMRRVPAQAPPHQQRPAPADPEHQRWRPQQSHHVAQRIPGCRRLFNHLLPRQLRPHARGVARGARHRAARPPPCRAPPPEHAAVNPRVGIVVLADTASEARYVATQRYSQKSLDNKRAYADHRGLTSSSCTSPRRRCRRPGRRSTRCCSISTASTGSCIWTATRSSRTRRSASSRSSTTPSTSSWRRTGAATTRAPSSSGTRRSPRAAAEDGRRATGKLDLAVALSPGTPKRYRSSSSSEALHYLTDTASWRKWKCPVADEGAARRSCRRRAHAVPHQGRAAVRAQRGLVRPRLASGPSAKVAARAAYQPGDFVVHLAGHKGENKTAPRLRAATLRGRLRRARRNAE